MQFANLSLVLFLTSIVIGGACAAALWSATVRRKRILRTLIAPPLDQTLTSSVAPGKRRLRTALFLFGILCVLLALARPWWGTRLVPAPKRSRDLLFVLDCSRSMLARDVSPSRLEHAKWWVRELVAKCPGDRFGLVVFSGDAFLQCPLTQDVNTFLQFLTNADTRSVAVGGTNIASALDVTQKAFQAAEGSHRAVILISDGEELEGEAKGTVDAMKTAGTPIFAVGVGNPDQGSMIQTEEKALLRDAAGNLVTTRLNESGLKALSQATAGIYVRSNTLNPSVLPVQERVRRLTPQEGVQGTQQRPLERFYIPLLLGLLCLLARLCIGERRSGAALLSGTALLWILPLAGSQAQTVTDLPQVLPPPSKSAARPPPVTRPTPVTKPVLTQPKSKSAALDTTGGNTPTVKDAGKEEERLQTALTRAQPEEAARLHFNLGCLYQQDADKASQAEAEYEKALAVPSAPRAVRAAAYQNLGTLSHTKARTTLQSDPDAAIKELHHAQNLYRESLRLAQSPAEPAGNQELLLRDLRLALDVKKMSDAIKKQLQDAVQQTTEAQQAQQKADAQTAADQKQPDASAAQTQTGEAGDAVQKLTEMTRGKVEEQTQQRFDGAQQEIQNAIERQLGREPVKAAQPAEPADAAKPDGDSTPKTAAEHLTKALELLGAGGDQKPDQKPDEQKDKKADDKKEKSKDEKSKEEKPADSANKDKQEPPQPKPSEKLDFQPGKEDKAAGQEKSTGAEPLDNQQAVMLLQQMQKSEQDFREAVKRQQQQNKLKPVEKDW